jgi:uncharacterized protein with NAD-binding domain and iron-sulfur cluster
MNQPSGRKKVIIVGGGVAGLSAAHELVNRGFEVHVYERRHTFGGKARGPVKAVEAIGADGAPKQVTVPVEHGFRFFPGFYRHVIATMEEIQTADGPVSRHLVPVRELRFVGNTASNPVVGIVPLMPLWHPAYFLKWVGFLPSLMQLAPGADGRHLSADDIGFFAARMWRFLTTCEERREAELEGTNWFEYLGSSGRSEAYRRYLGIGLTRNLVACKAQKASTVTVGTIGLQIILDVLYGILLPRRVDRVLDAPTSEVWFNPWIDQLTRKGVHFHADCELSKIHVEPGSKRVSALSFRQTQRPEDAGRQAADVTQDPSMTVQAERLSQEVRDKETADHYVFALPIEQMGTFVTKEVRAEAPAWGVLPDLAKSVDWMTGVMFYLKNDADLPTAHDDYLDSDWALTSIFQDQALWPRFAAHAGRQPEVRRILSVCISDWTAPRTRGAADGRAAVEFQRRDVAALIWEQVKEALAARPEYRIDDAALAFSYVDEDIQDVRKQVTFRRSMAAKRLHHKALLTNAEPLLVNRAGTRRLRPHASGDLDNAHLASDYVRTTTDLATMEGANEAARRAVNEILRQEGRSDRCRLFPIREPLGVLRAMDRAFFERGKPLPFPLTAGEVVIRKGMVGLVKIAQVANAAVKVASDAAAALPFVGSFIGKGAR